MKPTEVGEIPKLGALAFTGLFMAAFGAVAIIFGLLPIAQAVFTAWRANSLVEVAATINAAQLERGTRSRQQHQRSLSARGSVCSIGRAGAMARDGIKNGSTNWSKREKPERRCQRG